MENGMMLAKEHLLEWCGKIHMPRDALTVLLEISTQTRADEVLSTIFAKMYEGIVLSG